MITIGVLYGGRSGEHDVSLCSAASVVSRLDRTRYNIVAIGIDRDGRWYVQDEPVIVDDRDFGKKLKLEKTGEWNLNHFECCGLLVLAEAVSGKRVEVDVVFPVMHGTFCEDGTLQGLLDLAMVPYVGVGVLGSAVGMDKDIAKRVLRDTGIPVVPWIVVQRHRWNTNRDEIIKNIMDDFSLPLFVKPSNAGSSVGVRKVKSYDELESAIDFALKYDMKALVEEGIDAREIECAVLGNDDPRSSVLGEIIPKHEFYSYDAKYIDPDGASLVIPAIIDPASAEKIRGYAVAAFAALGCSGLSRVDFFVDRKSGNIFLNEINTLPGFTSISMYPKLWEHTGIKYEELLDRLIELAIERNSERKNILTEL